MLAIVGALDEEVSGVRRQMTITETRTHPSIFAGEYRNKKVVLARSGVGRERVERAVRAVFERYAVTAVVSLGFGGALNSTLSGGEIIVSTTLKCPDSSECLASDAKLVSLAGGRCGTGVTVARAAQDAAGKRQLGVDYTADVVDMESYWVARLAAERGVPFLSVRAISDAVDETIPDLFPDGTRWGMVRTIARHPYRVFGHPVALWRLYRNVSKAKANLTDFTLKLIEAAG